MKKVLLWILAIALLFGCISHAAEEGEAPALRFIYRPEGQTDVEADADTGYELQLTEDMKGRWAWLQVPEDVPLETLEISYFPDDGMNLKIYYIYVILNSKDAPIALDFSGTEDVPFPYIVEDIETEEMLWFGWLTVSHAERPEDLPVAPVSEEPSTSEETAPAESAEPTEAPAEPEETETPEAEPTPSPEPAPTETPIPVPTEAPTPESPLATEVPAAEPAETPTPEPPLATEAPAQESLEPTQAPELTAPVPGPTPMPLTGYAVITGRVVNVRLAPMEQVQGLALRGDIVYVTGQLTDAAGTMWHAVEVLGRSSSGYIRDDLMRFMSSWEVQEYESRSAPAPTFQPTEASPTAEPTPDATPEETLAPTPEETPAPLPEETPAPTPVPSPVPELPTEPTAQADTPASGYYRVVEQSAPLYATALESGKIVNELSLGTVVYVDGSEIDGLGRRWVSVQVGGDLGYMLQDHTVPMTREEADAHLQSLKPPPVPPTPSADSSDTIVTVNQNNVNFRATPNGHVIRRLKQDTTAILLDTQAKHVDGYDWFNVEVNGAIGYLRSDMINFVEISATLEPIVTPTPAPGTTTDRLRAWLDAQMLAEYARNVSAHEADAYVMRDFDADQMMELVVFNLKKTPEGANGLEMTTCVLQDGQVTRIEGATKWYVPLLTPYAELQVAVARQDGRDIVCISQRHVATGESDFGFGLTLLPDRTWERVSLTAATESPVPVLVVRADATGGLIIDDRSGLRDSAEPVDKETFSLLMEVLYDLVNEAEDGDD